MSESSRPSIASPKPPAKKPKAVVSLLCLFCQKDPKAGQRHKFLLTANNYLRWLFRSVWIILGQSYVLCRPMVLLPQHPWTDGSMGYTSLAP